MFTVTECTRVSDRILELAAADERVVAAAVVGSLVDGGDRWSDLDLTFGVDAPDAVTAVIEDFTRALADEYRAVPLLDLARAGTTYRVFLLPGLLQVDLSFAPAQRFRQASPRFRIVFGQYRVDHAPPRAADDVLGWGVLWARNAYTCVQRGRWWEAEYDISALRDAALTLACLRRGLPVGYGRSFDRLPPVVLAAAHGALVRSLDPEELSRALRAAVELLLGELGDAGELAARVEPSLRELLALE